MAERPECGPEPGDDVSPNRRSLPDCPDWRRLKSAKPAMSVLQRRLDLVEEQYEHWQTQLRLFEWVLDVSSPDSGLVEDTIEQALQVLSSIDAVVAEIGDLNVDLSAALSHAAGTRDRILTLRHEAHGVLKRLYELTLR